jgi:hypothetical protein
MRLQIVLHALEK